MRLKIEWDIGSLEEKNNRSGGVWYYAIKDKKFFENQIASMKHTPFLEVSFASFKKKGA